jgi:predicted phage terminase large subunit-like protein
MAHPTLERVLKDLREKRKAQLREAAQRSLYEFFQQAWPYFDSVDFMGNWHLEAICEHLEAVNHGEIKRLIVNVPPRTAKTALIGVAWPLWTWIQDEHTDTCGPGAQFLFASYSYDLSVKSAEKSRRLLFSKWFQENFGDKFSILADSNRKDDFTNDFNGARLSTSVSGTLTGLGGSLICIDDPNSATDADSKAVRETTNLWWDEALSTRLNNPKTGAFVVVQQRLHMEDITGHILSNSSEDWTHLCFPMRYDSSRACPADIRTEDNELLWPERFGEMEVSELEKRLGPVGTAGQLQQIPQNRGSSIVSPDMWMDWPHRHTPPLDYIVASLDTGMTEKEESDNSALVVLGSFQAGGSIVGDESRGYDFIAGQDMFNEEGESRIEVTTATVPKIMLLHAWQAKIGVPELARRVLETCLKFKVHVLLIENKAHGHAVNQTLREILAQKPFSIVMFDPRKYGDKTARLYSVQHLFAEGLIYAPIEKAWADMVIQDVSAFPRGAHDDLTDALGQGLHHMRQCGFAAMRETAVADIISSLRHKSKPKRLYDT